MSQPAFEFDDVPVDEPGDPTFTVGELADAIDERLRSGFRDGVWVRGEINGLKRSGQHVYFSLVEKERRSEAKLDIKLFANKLARLTPKLRSNRLDLRDGMKVRIHGQIDFYKARGALSVVMDDIDPRYTLGEIAQSREEVLKRLIASGLTGMNKQQRLSPIPLRIGVAASVESAGFADFESELRNSGFSFQLVVADTRVQGDGADRMIAGSIGTLARGARKGVLDAIVVIRGGGAKNELAVFDSERIATTIAMVSCPVLTGIGHEIDRTIADEVAHTSLKTPTACAGELIDRVASYVNDTEIVLRGNRPSSALAHRRRRPPPHRHGPAPRRAHHGRGRTGRRATDHATRSAGDARSGRARRRPPNGSRPRRSAYSNDRTTPSSASPVDSTCSQPASQPSTRPSNSLAAGRSPVTKPATSCARSTTSPQAPHSPPISSTVGSPAPPPVSLPSRRPPRPPTPKAFPMTDSTAPSDTPGYADALRELDGILRELEGSDVDVDRLAERVGRASELITMCRDKITTAELQIRQVTTDLDAAADQQTVSDTD